MEFVINQLTTFKELPGRAVPPPSTELLRERRTFDATGRRYSHSAGGTTDTGLVSILRQPSNTSSKPKRPVKFNPQVRVRHMKE